MSERVKKLPSVWLAKWIDPELAHDKDERQPASVLRRRFSAERTENAVLYITSHGLYEAYLNGERIGHFVLAPGTGDYSKRLTVQAYDVSSLLHVGENEITVTLGDGWYRGSVGIDGLRNYYGDDIALLCQLEADGKPLLCSDEEWEASQNGPVRENDLQQGEHYDARMENVTLWHGVTVRNFGFDNLAPTESVPVLEQERFAGKLIQDAGLKGYQIGQAAVSEKHAGFVVNLGGASATDIWQVCQDVRHKVKEQFDVVLEMEVKTLGTFPTGAV